MNHSNHKNSENQEQEVRNEEALLSATCKFFSAFEKIRQTKNLMDDNKTNWKY